VTTGRGARVSENKSSSAFGITSSARTQSQNTGSPVLARETVLMATTDSELRTG
jgi:hypothetical protein